MSKAYVLFQFSMSDTAKFGLYIQNAAPTVLANGGNVLVAAADADVREGTLMHIARRLLSSPLVLQPKLGMHHRSMRCLSICAMRLPLRPDLCSSMGSSLPLDLAKGELRTRSAASDRG